MNESKLNKIRSELIEQLQLRRIATSYFLDLVESYIELCALEDKLKEDIKNRGVSVKSETGAGKIVYKKNDSVGLLVNVVKQKQDTLIKMGISPETIVTADDVDEL